MIEFMMTKWQEEEQVDSDDEWTEVTGREEAGVYEPRTVVMPQSMVPDAEALQRLDEGDFETLSKISRLAFAPAEGSHPLSLYQDNDMLTLGFPTIFAGQRVRLPKGVHFSEWVKWLCMHVDSRPRQEVELLFALMKRLQLEACLSNISIAMRKGQFGKVKGATVRDLLANHGDFLQKALFKVRTYLH